MRPSLLVSLVLLSLLLHKTEAIRFDKGLFMELLGHQKIQEEKNSLVLERSSINGGVIGDVILCKEGHCSTGMNRKLVTVTTSTSSITPTSTTSKNEKINGGNSDNTMRNIGSINGEMHGKHENSKPSVKFSSLPVSKHHPEATHDHYVDNMDIAEMDYSPARRKPPIHN